MKVLQGSLLEWTGVTLGVLWDNLGGTFKTTLGVALGPFEGTLGALWVVPWSYIYGTLRVALGILLEYCEGTLRVVWGQYDGPWGSLLGYPGGDFWSTLGLL